MGERRSWRGRTRVRWENDPAGGVQEVCECGCGKSFRRRWVKGGVRKRYYSRLCAGRARARARRVVMVTEIRGKIRG